MTDCNMFMDSKVIVIDYDDNTDCISINYRNYNCDYSYNLWKWFCGYMTQLENMECLIIKSDKIPLWMLEKKHSSLKKLFLPTNLNLKQHFLKGIEKVKIETAVFEYNNIPDFNGVQEVYINDMYILHNIENIIRTEGMILYFFLDKVEEFNNIYESCNNKFIFKYNYENLILD